MACKCRQNYHEECEALVNKQINIELSAYQQYLAMYAYYDRDDVACKGFAKFFKDCADEESGHAEKLISYQNLRGGRVVMKEIAPPSVHEWATPSAAVEFALNLEKQVNEALLSLHKLAMQHSDPHLMNFLEKNFLDEQIKAINKLAVYLTELVRVGEGLGEHIFDRDLL